MEKTTLYLPQELHEALRHASRRTGEPQARLIRDALMQYLQRVGPPRPKSIGLGNDPELAAQESERWLEREWSGKSQR